MPSCLHSRVHARRGIPFRSPRAAVQAAAARRRCDRAADQRTERKARRPRTPVPHRRRLWIRRAGERAEAFPRRRAGPIADRRARRHYRCSRFRIVLVQSRILQGDRCTRCVVGAGRVRRLPNRLGLATRLLSVTPSAIAQAEATLRSTPGVVAVSQSRRLVSLAVSTPYLGDDP